MTPSRLGCHRFPAAGVTGGRASGFSPAGVTGGRASGFSPAQKTEALTPSRLGDPKPTRLSQIPACQCEDGSDLLAFPWRQETEALAPARGPRPGVPVENSSPPALAVGKV